jgi:hypothetical protein
MSGELEPILVGRVWRDPDCDGEPLAVQHRRADGEIILTWSVDPESLQGLIWIEILEGEESGDPSAS